MPGPGQRLGRPAGAGGEEPRRVGTQRPQHLGSGGVRPVGPEDHGPGSGVPHRPRQARRRGRGTQHVGGDPPRGQRGGQRGQREGVVLRLHAGQHDQHRVRRDRRPGDAMQCAEYRPRQPVLDVHAVRVQALIGVDRGKSRTAHQVPPVHDAPAGQHAVEQDAAAFGVRGPGRADQVGGITFGRDGLGFTGLHRAGGLGREHAQSDQVQHPAQPGDVLLRVAAVPARPGPLRTDVVPAVPRPQRRLGDA